MTKMKEMERFQGDIGGVLGKIISDIMRKRGKKDEEKDGGED